jgi:predicted Zn-dependent protease
MRTRQVVRWVLCLAALGVAAGAAWAAYRFAEGRDALRAAERALADQDPDRTRTLLADMPAGWRDRLDVRLLGARAAREAGDLDAAEEQLTACERLVRPEDSRGNDVSRQRLLLQMCQGDLGGNLERLSPEEPADPALTADELEAVARGFVVTHDLDDAMACLAHLDRKQPSHVRGLVLAGEVLQQVGKFDDAVDRFTRAVERRPGDRLPRVRLAGALILAGRVREAEPHVAALLERFPDDPEVLLAAARLARYRGDIPAARDLLDRTLAEHPDHAAALLIRGQIECQDGDVRRAIGFLERAARADPAAPEPWEGLIHCYTALDRPSERDRCRAELDRLRAERGACVRLEYLVQGDRVPNPPALVELAERNERLHRFADAIGWRFRVLVVTPQDRSSRRALAALFEAVGQPHRAARQRALAEAAAP